MSDAKNVTVTGLNNATEASENNSAFATLCGLGKEYGPHSMVGAVEHLNQYVPDSIWQTLPTTIASSLLGLFLVPWALRQIDVSFRFVADHRSKKMKQIQKQS